MRCFFCENLESDYINLEKSEHKHLFKVLRAEIGENLLLIDCKGSIAEGVIEAGEKIKINKRVKYQEPANKIHLFVAVPKKHKMDMLLAQCTEAGVWSIHPIIAERNVSVPKKENADDKWNDKLIEACKQSHNPFLPKINLPIKLSEAVELIRKENFNAYYGVVDEPFLNNDRTEQGKIKNFSSKGNKIAWFIGPEGGFSEDEIRLMNENNFTGISLGKWVMRVETAAVVGVALLQN